MPYIALIAIIGIVVLQATGSIPLSSVGGPLVIGLAAFAASLAVGVHEAWTMRRGVLGWIVNLIVAILGTFVFGQLGGLLVVILLSPFMDRPTLATSSGLVPYVAVAGMMLACVLGSWVALQIVNRWR